MPEDNTTNKPNILLIMADQFRGDCLSLERHPVLLTPVIDEIGGMGTHFHRMYTTCASCIPARRCLLTGEHPATNGLVGFVYGYRLTHPTFTRWHRFPALRSLQSNSSQLTHAARSPGRTGHPAVPTCSLHVVLSLRHQVGR